ncbi:hypothetical protein [Geodermatophilus ruber]|uniref:Repeat domain-containing protein n=1 Tax=Geodermatophilus ruber TaxID=504800 RepID=A0A1I4L4P0_9ACTN|nr:hypothetical protein [Geodermatophilus ruber]SFL85839.1 hypothetical protein SAMN04488085_1207 [Geodermatophilus ruber]
MTLQTLLALELPVPVVPRPSSRLLALAAAAAAVLPVVAPTAASADPGETVVGELVQAWAEHPQPASHGGGGLLSWIAAGNGDAVRVPTEDVAGIEAGATVSVVVGGEVAEASPVAADLEPAREVLAAGVVADAPADPPVARAAAGTTNAVTVVMVVPAGATPDARTRAEVVAAVDGPVAAFWAEQTGGAVQLGVTASFDWFQASAGCADPYALWNQAAAHAGWVRAPQRHLLLYVPSDAPGCASGLAEIGSSLTSGGRLYVREAAPSVLAHELGHNFGLGHASLLQCDGAVDAGACGVTGYGDWYDVMGISWQQLGSLNAAHAARLGVLPAGTAPTVAAGAPPTQVTLAPVGARTGTRALRLTDPAGRTYWLEYRTATGRDGWLGTAGNWRGLQSGVQLRLAGDGADTSLLLDPTPSGSAQWSADGATAFPVNIPVSFAGGAFTVTVLEAGAQGARLEVRPGQAVAAPPAATQGTGEIGGTGFAYFLNDAFSGIANWVFAYGSPLDSVFVGDWDGDGVDTLAVRRGNTFLVRDSNTTGAADRTFAYGDPGDAVLVGDWDGDGRDTLAVRRGNQYLVRNSLTTGVADGSFFYGDPGDVVLVGDWDGDRADSLTVRRGALWFVKNGLTTGVADTTFGYGDPGDTVLVGRWRAGQRGDTLAVRRGNLYHLRFSLTSGPADQVVAYGDVTDTAFAGDWNADGVDTLGVRRPG